MKSTGYINIFTSIKVDYLISHLLFFSLAGVTTSCINKPVKNTGVIQEQERVNSELFSEHIRTTEARTPEEEKAGFKLPPGFEIELFASEPEIGKPINMAFDTKGRLWITGSFEYPFAADPGKGKDRITILEDGDGDGKAEKITHFADTLNIPIGILPLHGGAIAHSIPNLYRFTDANGDRKADAYEKLLGPFGYKDTHGMVSNLTRGFDGWIHACHGFTNTSNLAGSDGDSLRMTSGNTFKFSPDGRHAEQTTYGRVNPFGMVFDEKGYLYSVDCHSSPIYQLIMGADYPHFGKKEEGIGFAPSMKPHGTESTALSGLAYYADTKFPQEYRQNFFLGDVVTSRVHRNTFYFKGSTPVAAAASDFLLSEDPWFRPVDVKMGPDGALYIADFYNRIIGHYEVPLNNPGRDRIRGRIWRVTYKGNGKNTPLASNKDWSVATLDELIRGLSHSNLTVRLTAADQLVDQIGQPAVQPLQALLQDKATQPTTYTHGLWVLGRMGALQESLLMQSITHREAIIKLHALRVLKEMPDREGKYAKVVLASLQDKDPHVQRAALEALVEYPSLEGVKTLLAFIKGIPKDDTHMKYTAMLSLRDLLREKSLVEKTMARQWNNTDTDLLANVMLGVHSATAGEFLFDYISKASLPKDSLLTFVQHVARHIPNAKMPEVVAFTRQKFEADLSTQFNIYNTLQQGLAQKGGKSSKDLLDWGVKLAQIFIGQRNEWTYRTSGKTMLTRNPVISYKKKIDSTTHTFVGFDQSGFKGVILSPVFEIPPSLSFTAIINEGGKKAENDPSAHVIRLRLLEDTSQVLARLHFTKEEWSDRILQTSWNLAAHQGKKGYLEVGYGPFGFVYAGKFEPTSLQVPAIGPNEVAARQKFALEVIGNNRLSAFASQAKAYLADNAIDHFVRVTAARSLLQLDAGNYASLVGAMLADTSQPLLYRKEIAEIMGEFSLPGVTASLVSALPGAPYDFQLALVKALAASPEGKTALLKQVREGKLKADILLDPKVEERILLNSSEKQRGDYKELTANLEPVNQEREKLIKQRLAHFSTSNIQKETGRVLFVQNCSPCHQIAKEGGLIGPQLDGVGNWGAQLLATKILDPNRNISEAFRVYTLRLKNGKVLSGLYRREEGQVLVFANVGGEEFSVAKNEIAEKQASKYTLMPDHFGEVLEQENFNSLLSYLLSMK